MYQLPVQKLGCIRTSRKRVKEILTDIGLDSCQDLWKEMKRFDAGELSYNTEWEDLTDSYRSKRRRKWWYRTETLCCSLCWFSTRSWYSFKSHVQRCHEEETKLATLSGCSHCPYVSQPALVNRHTRLFHPQAPGGANTDKSSSNISSSTISSTIISSNTSNTQIGERVFLPGVCGDKYSCTTCGFHDSLLYAMRKHVLVTHCEALLKSYYGIRSATASNKQGGTSTAAAKRPGAQSKFFCRGCEMPAETSEHLLYHLLSSDKHSELNTHISPMLVEHMISMKSSTTNTRVPTLPPRAMQQVVSMVSNKAATKNHPPPPNGKLVPSQGTVLLATPPQTTALVCSTTGGQQILLANPNTASTATATLPSPTGTPFQLLLQPGMQGKQVVLPSGVTLNIGKVNHSQPTVMSQQAQRLKSGGVTHTLLTGTKTNQPVMLAQVKGATGGAVAPSQNYMFAQVKSSSMGTVGPSQFLAVGGKVNASQPVLTAGGQLLSSQSNVRLVPTGNQVNGVPTYTLVAVPIQTAVTTTNINKQSIMVTIPQQPGQTQAVVGQKSSLASINENSEAKQLVTKSQYLVRTDCGFVRCLRCKTLLSDKGIFQHLLHGLQCLFCPLIFYSLKQLLAHNEAAHSLKDPQNRQRARKEYLLETTDDGRLTVPAFSMKTTLPKDLLGCKKLELALITESRGNKVLYLHLSEEPGKPPAPALPPNGCLFCPGKPLSPVAYEQHLRQQHHVLPTIHAILKTPAFKCVYCLGVYTDKLTGKTISIHVQRCRCAPRSVKDSERLLNPDTQSPNETRDGGTVSTCGRNGRSVPSTILLLEPPAGMELRSPEERKYFLGQYFNKKPYPSRKETESLASRLKLSRPEVMSYFDSRQSSCVQDCQRLRFRVLLGFDTTHIQSLKLNMDLRGTGATSSGLQIKMEEFSTTAPVKEEPDSPEPCSSETLPEQTVGKHSPDSTPDQDTSEPITIKTELEREQEEPLRNGSCPD